VDTVARIRYFPAITELDVNLLVVALDDAVGVDVRLTVDRDELSAPK